jgi:hypothetical protein
MIGFLYNRVRATFASSVGAVKKCLTPAKAANMVQIHTAAEILPHLEYSPSLFSESARNLASTSSPSKKAQDKRLRLKRGPTLDRQAKQLVNNSPSAPSWMSRAQSQRTSRITPKKGFNGQARSPRNVNKARKSVDSIGIQFQLDSLMIRRSTAAAKVDSIRRNAAQLNELVCEVIQNQDSPQRITIACTAILGILIQENVGLAIQQVSVECSKIGIDTKDLASGTGLGFDWPAFSTLASLLVKDASFLSEDFARLRNCILEIFELVGLTKFELQKMALMQQQTQGIDLSGNSYMANDRSWYVQAWHKDGSAAVPDIFPPPAHTDTPIPVPSALSTSMEDVQASPAHNEQDTLPPTTFSASMEDVETYLAPSFTPTPIPSRSGLRSKFVPFVSGGVLSSSSNGATGTASMFGLSPPAPVTPATQKPSSSDFLKQPPFFPCSGMGTATGSNGVPWLKSGSPGLDSTSSGFGSSSSGFGSPSPASDGSSSSLSGSPSDPAGPSSASITPQTRTPAVNSDPFGSRIPSLRGSSTSTPAVATSRSANGSSSTAAPAQNTFNGPEFLADQNTIRTYRKEICDFDGDERNVPFIQMLSSSKFGQAVSQEKNNVILKVVAGITVSEDDMQHIRQSIRCVMRVKDLPWFQITLQEVFAWLTDIEELYDTLQEEISHPQVSPEPLASFYSHAGQIIAELKTSKGY